MPVVQPLDPTDELRELAYRRKRENRLKTLGLFKNERDVFAKEEWGEWFDQLLQDRLRIRRKSIILAWDTATYKDEVRKWYRRNKWLKPPKKPHERRDIDAWGCLATYKKRWHDDNPSVPTTPKPPVITIQQLDYHEQLFRKRYKERTSKR